MEYLGNQIDNIMEPARFHLNVLLWNCSGISNSDAINTIHDLVDSHHLDIMIGTKTMHNKDRFREVAD